MNATHQSPAAFETLDVCICTFRRKSIEDTLRSIAQQALPPGWRTRIVIADNDTTAKRRDELEQLGHTLALDILYVHAPEKNISRARNACLTHARSRWIAFIDDDEVARTDWLAQLIAARGDAHCVFGVAQAIYDRSTPRWIVEGDFHSHTISPREAQSNGSTCNVMMERTFIEHHGLRFREDLGRVGGEDTMFFSDMARCGAVFRFAPEAVVEEQVVPARASIKWLALRRFRSGQIHFLLLRRANRRRLTIAAAAFAKVAYCGLAAMLSLNMVDRASRILRGSLHLGVLASAVGAGLYEEYS